MKTKYFLLIFFLMQQSSCFITKQTTHLSEKEIFRYIDIGRNYRLYLNDQINKHEAHLVKTKTGEYKLKNKGYGDAHEIFIMADSKNTIRGFKFTYINGENFEEKVHSYEIILGKPLLYDNSALWQDKKTKFMILKDSTGAVISELMDK
jgi:hypothetical protein